MIKDPSATLRRIQQLEERRRRVGRAQTKAVPSSAYGQELTREAEELDDQLMKCREAVSRAEADGYKVWGPKDFTPGDFVRIEDVWFEVLRVNPRSLTIPDPMIAAEFELRVVRKGDGGRLASWTRTVLYRDSVSGRMSAQDMTTGV